MKVHKVVCENATHEVVLVTGLANEIVSGGDIGYFVCDTGYEQDAECLLRGEIGWKVERLGHLPKFMHDADHALVRRAKTPAVDPRDARIAELEAALAAERTVSDAQKARADKAEADKRIAENNRDERDQAATDYRREVARLHGLIKESSEHNERMVQRAIRAESDRDGQKMRANAAEKYRTDAQATLTCAASVIEMLLDWHTLGPPQGEENEATVKGALAGVRCVQRAITEACK